VVLSHVPSCSPTSAAHGNFPPPQGARKSRIREKATRDPWCRRLDVQLDMTAAVCTAAYRAPELVAATMTLVCLDATCGPRRIAYGVAIDVWSYGAVLWEMLRGTPTWTVSRHRPARPGIREHDSLEGLATFRS